MQWFGTPWPSVERRAPVCSNDQNRVPTPVGVGCGTCRRALRSSDSGVLIPHVTGGQGTYQRPYHVRCFVRMVLGPLDTLMLPPGGSS